MDRAIVTMLLQLLTLSFKKRLALVLGLLVVSLEIYWIAFPTIIVNNLCLLLSIIFATWLLSWRGGLLCIAGICVVSGARYGLAFNSWSYTLFLSLVVSIVPDLIAWLVASILRMLADMLIDTQQQTMQLEQACQCEYKLNEVKDQGLHTISHELRTSLTQIQGYLELLEMCHAHLDFATRSRFIERAQSGCEEMLGLVTVILDTGKSMSQPLRLQEFSLYHEVQAVFAQLDPRMFETHNLHLDISESLLVYADPRFVRQIVRNLLTNAFKYTPTSTCIVVSAAPMGEQSHVGTRNICVCVSDEGPGIPLEQQSLLFQRFVRLPNATQSDKSGFGLGLAICKQLVETMGGCIWVENNRKTGKGCSFLFTLAGAARCPFQSNDDHISSVAAEGLVVSHKH